MSFTEELYDALHPTEWREPIDIRQRMLKNRGVDLENVVDVCQISLGQLYVGLHGLVKEGYAEQNRKILSPDRQVERNQETVVVYRRTEKELPVKEQNYVGVLQPVRA